MIAGHAFMQNLRRGHYELAADARPALRVAAAFTELAKRSDACPARLSVSADPQCKCEPFLALTRLTAPQSGLPWVPLP